MSQKKKVPFNIPCVVGKELEYIAQAIESKQLAGLGPFTLKCQQWFESTTSCHKALLTHSCTAALEMAALIIDLKPGDEVIMPSFTFVSTANAIVLRGAVSVFVDINPDTLNIDENLIEAAITPHTKAILPVHYAGLGCEMDKIMDIARKHGLYVIEDAAQALNTTYNDKYLGAIGDLGCLSFHETKNITSGEGGALFINNPELMARAEVLWEKGTNRKQFFRGEVDKYTWVEVGSSFQPSELEAAFLWAQIEAHDTIAKDRCNTWNTYDQGLKHLAEQGVLGVPAREHRQQCNGHIYHIITADIQERTQLIDHLKQHGVYAVFHYIPLHSSPAGQNYGRTHGEMTQTNDVSERLLRLPLYYNMPREDIDRVISLIDDFYNR